MFLLIPRAAELSVAVFDALHSTMFLLIRWVNRSFKCCSNVFTFHNVSINTNKAGAESLKKITLHSTMFLLILFHFKFWKNTFCHFTFHNVSINTIQNILAGFTETSLHSTMFLLIQRSARSGFQKPGRLYIPQCFY